MEEGASDEAAETSLKNERGSWESEKIVGEEKNSREGGAAGEAGQVKVFAHPSKGMYCKSTWDQGAYVREWVELGWVGFCFADRIRQDGVRNAKV